MAISASGNFLVAFIFGKPHIINIVNPTKPTMYPKEVPSSQTFSSPTVCLNIPN